VIYIRKREELRISALLALFSIPISIPFYGVLIHGGGESILVWIYLPVVIASLLVGNYDLAVASFLPIQFFGYFLGIYLLLKILRKLEIIGEPGKTQEELESTDSTNELNFEEKVFIRGSIILFILGLFILGFMSLHGPSLFWPYYLLTCFGVMVLGIVFTITSRKRRPVIWKLMLANSWLIIFHTYFLIRLNI